jgi:hypothetical protein
MQGQGITGSSAPVMRGGFQTGVGMPGQYAPAPPQTPTTARRGDRDNDPRIIAKRDAATAERAKVNAGVGLTPTGTPIAPTTGPTAPILPGGTGGPQLPDLSQIPPLFLPTIQSQNQVMALGAQNASPLGLMSQLVGNQGIQTSSGTVLSKLMQPAVEAYRTAASTAANIGLDDQLARDNQLMRGIEGFGSADVGRGLANAGRDRLLIGAQNRSSDALIDALSRLIGGASLGNITSQFGNLLGGA